MYILLDPFEMVEFKQGDLLSLTGTLFFTLHIQVLQKITEKFNEPKIFAFYQVFFITIFSTVMILATKGVNSFLLFRDISLSLWIILFILGAIVMLAFFIQAKFQSMTTPSRAVVIYNLQPALAAFFSYLIIGEIMSARSIIGAIVVILSIIVAQYIRFRNNKDSIQITG